MIPDDELLKDIKEIKLKTFENLKQQLLDMKKAYIKKMFPNIYIIVPEEVKPFISNDVKEAYKIIATKKFGSDKIEIITENSLMEKIIDSIIPVIDETDIKEFNEPIIKILTDKSISNKYSELLNVKKLSSKKEE